MLDMKFRSKEHKIFFMEMMNQCRSNACYNQAFFYIMGITAETRRNILKMFNFKTSSIIPQGMNGGWQTSGTLRVCHLAFNLWNGYMEEEYKESYTPYDLFCCEFAIYFMEGIKLRYPEYCIV